MQRERLVVMASYLAGKIGFQNHPHLVHGIGHDEESQQLNHLCPIEPFVCHLSGAPELPTVDKVRLQLFDKASRGLEMFLPIREAVEVHAARTNYQAQLWLPEDQEHGCSHPSAWTMESDCLKIV